MNKVLEYNVTGQNIELSSAATLVAGTVNEYTARFSFNGDWNGYQRVAVFNADGTEREQLLTDDTCKVPWEVLLPGAYLKVGVYGTKNGSRLPTIWTSHRQYIHDGAGPTDEAAAPSPVLAEQILQRMGDLGELKTEDKSSLVAAINEVQETGGGGTADHAKLKNRDAADQHPMSAITGLADALAGKQPTGDYLTEEQDPTVPEWAKQPQKPAYTAQEVGALPATTAIPSTAADVNAEPSGAVSQHDVSGAAHSDIRLLIQGLSERLSAVADSDDATLDQLSEIVEYIKSNRDLISAITTSKVNVSDIVDNLTTNAANKPLSAAQGVALKSLIDAISIPDKLPNPNALTFTGAVTGSYDGSAPVSVEIPSGGGGKWEKVYECSAVDVTEAVSKIEIDLGGRVTNGKEEYVIQVELSKSTLETVCKGVVNCNLDGIGIGYFLLNWATPTSAFNFDFHGNLVTRELQVVNDGNSLVYNAINVKQQRSARFGTNSNYEGKFVISFPAEWAGKYSVNIFVK